MNSFHCYRNIAFSNPDVVRKAQEILFAEHLMYCHKHSPYYRDILHASTIDYTTISLDRLSDLPFTEKSDIEQHNEDFRAVPRADIVDIVLSSGTTGKPIKVMYSEYDLKRLAYNEEQSFRGCGISVDDVVLLTCTMDRCFVAGLAYFLGIRALGAAAIRNGLNSMESHLEIIKCMAPTVIVGVPSFLKKLGLYLQEKDKNLASKTVSKLVCIGEPIRDKHLQLLKVGSDLQEIWQAKAFSTYASTETVTTFCECTAQQGGHLHPELAIVEIVDEKDTVLPAGVPGEVVVTPMAVRGMPLLRFKTGDVSFLINEPCSCGRTSVRLGPILGRKKHMMKIRGTTVYPQAIYAALDEIKAVSDYFIIATNKDDLSDSITIFAAVKETSCTADFIREKLQARLRVKPAVVIRNEEAIKEQIFTPKSRKPIRFIDRR